MSKTSGSTRIGSAKMALNVDGGVKKQIYDYYNEVYDKNVKSLTKELDNLRTLNDKQRERLFKNISAYKKNKERGTEKAFVKDLNEQQVKYGKITSLKSILFLKDTIAFHAQERAYRSIIPQIEKKLKQ